MRKADLIGLACVGLSLIATAAAGILAFRVRQPVGWAALGVALVLAIVHPGWWISSRIGDCGFTRVLFSVAVLIAHGLVGGSLALGWLRGRRQPG